MKTIFIFDDSRPTDDLHPVIALGEDGLRVTQIKFDNFTAPYCQFAMGAVHELKLDDTDISEPVETTRARVLRQYDIVYGAGNWFPLWLDTPRSNPDWLRAMRLCRERERDALRPVHIAQPFSDGALAGILGDIFGTAASAPRVTH